MKPRACLCAAALALAAGPELGSAPTAAAKVSAPLLATGFEAKGADPLRDALLKLRHTAADGGALQVDYVGSERGSERVTAQVALPEACDEATLCYDVRFPEGFDFAKGGKLHGLGPAEPITGGQAMRTDGWSARVTFTAGGGIATYLYRQDKERKYGATQRAEAFRFAPGRYHAVSLHVRLNDPPADANGFAHLYVDGELLVRSDGVRFRGAGGGASRIQKLLFSTFHGGHTPDYAPRDGSGAFSTERAHFDNIAVHPGKFVRPEPGSEEWVYLERGGWRAGFLLTSGGGLAHLSRAGGDGRNLLDRHDRGRLVQQSYYGSEDGSKWAGTPWRYNPIQGGEYRGTGSLVRVAELAEGSFRCVTTPRHWASGKLLAECEMVQEVTVEGGLLHARYRFTYRGETTHPPRHQELPAVFFARQLDTLAVPSGDDFVTRKPGFPNERLDWDAKWAAYIGADGRGLGVCVPTADEATCYRFRDGGVSDCSYLAPIQTFALTPGLVFEYDAYFATGTPKEIRTAFAAILPIDP